MRLSQGKWGSGFTLIELMVTLAVLAILLVAAAPSFSDFIDKSRLKGAAQGAVDVINNARAESVRQGRDVRVAMKGTTTAWCLGANAAAEPSAPGEPIPAASACDCSTSPAACLVSGQQLVFATSQNDGVELSAAPSADFVFSNRLGTVDGLGTTTITMTSPRKTFDLELTVTPLGQVSLCVPASSDLPIAGYPSC
jgi:type IV fimbrial biogenesis protein FimT